MKGFISRYTEKTLAARLSIRFILQSWEYVILEEIQHELLEAPETTYNFEVEDFHMYFVGDNGVLVHNDCNPKLTNENADNVGNYLAKKVPKQVAPGTRML